MGKKNDRLVSVNGVSVDSSNVVEMLRTAKLSLKMKRPKQFHLRIDSGWTQLGFKLTYQRESDFLVILNINDGVVNDLNNFYKDRAIRCYDCIVAVNGFRPPPGDDDPSAALMTAIKG